ncbi:MULTISPECIES: hypothetical protein [unclassified Streptomyces]|uniref:hypothetical protein n=1 Tax=unclassified Streptomyces TaxID=2593676 RepID=UPI0006F4C40E|nr:MULTISPECIES: hypothetical protein [unclassified Streptomyces]KQX50703.1 hypothetical protein ASD33_11610 [Streptomyces sp. Root1304]KRA84868.1 hypothetical protein ASE09_11615 [Streptomyces sp. Root66D1]
METRASGDRIPAEAVRLLEALLSSDEPSHRALLAQIPFLHVIGRCSCSCASLVFDLDRSLVAAAPVSGTPMADATVVDADGEPVGGALVFAHDGYLSSLEVYAWGDDQIRRLPAPDRLR